MLLLTPSSLTYKLRQLLLILFTYRERTPELTLELQKQVAVPEIQSDRVAPSGPLRNTADQACALHTTSPLYVALSIVVEHMSSAQLCDGADRSGTPD